MKRNTVLTKLSQDRDALQAFHLRSLSLFGSVARDTATDASDVDILVDFEGGATFDRYIALSEHLEALLECQVDLIREPSLRPAMRAAIAPDVLHVIESTHVSR